MQLYVMQFRILQKIVLDFNLIGLYKTIVYLKNMLDYLF